MDQHDATPPERRPDAVVRDPREARDRHRARQGVSPGLAYLRNLTAEEDQWMRRTVARIAGRYRVDPDDLLQEVRLSLLQCRTVDAGREGLRSWLWQRVEWRAKDLQRRQGSITVPLDALRNEPTSPPPAGPGLSWNVDRLRRLGLTRDEAQTLLLVLWGLDLSLRDFAAHAERSYAKVRKDGQRGRKKIEQLLDLTPEECAALTAERSCRDIPAAAAVLGIDEAEFRSLRSAARATIARALEEKDRSDD